MGQQAGPAATCYRVQAINSLPHWFKGREFYVSFLAIYPPFPEIQSGGYGLDFLRSF